MSTPSLLSSFVKFALHEVRIDVVQLVATRLLFSRACRLVTPKRVGMVEPFPEPQQFQLPQGFVIGHKMFHGGRLLVV